jgi:hypothetical protein
VSAVDYGLESWRYAGVAPLKHLEPAKTGLLNTEGICSNTSPEGLITHARLVYRLSPPDEDEERLNQQFSGSRFDDLSAHFCQCVYNTMRTTGQTKTGGSADIDLAVFNPYTDLCGVIVDLDT